MKKLFNIFYNDIFIKNKIKNLRIITGLLFIIFAFISFLTVFIIFIENEEVNFLSMLLDITIWTIVCWSICLLIVLGFYLVDNNKFDKL